MSIKINIRAGFRYLKELKTEGFILIGFQSDGKIYEILVNTADAENLRKALNEPPKPSEEIEPVDEAEE